MFLWGLLISDRFVLCIYLHAPFLKLFSVTSYIKRLSRDACHLIFRYQSILNAVSFSPGSSMRSELEVNGCTVDLLCLCFLRPRCVCWVRTEEAPCYHHSFPPLSVCTLSVILSPVSAQLNSLQPPPPRHFLDSSCDFVLWRQLDFKYPFFISPFTEAEHRQIVNLTTNNLPSWNSSMRNVFRFFVL